MQICLKCDNCEMMQAHSAVENEWKCYVCGKLHFNVRIQFETDEPAVAREYVRNQNQDKRLKGSELDAPASMKEKTDIGIVGLIHGAYLKETKQTGGRWDCYIEDSDSSSSEFAV